MSNLETILFSTLLSKFFTKLGEMLLTGKTYAIKSKPLLMYNFSDVGIMLLCRKHHILEQGRYIRRTTIFIFSFCIGIVTQLNG